MTRWLPESWLLLLLVLVPAIEDNGRLIRAFVTFRRELEQIKESTR